MSWVDTFVENTKNAVADARKLGETLAPPNPAPPVTVYPATVGGIPTRVILYGAAGLILALVVWKIAK